MEGRRSPWPIWAVGLSVYLVAVFHRSSLAVAGLEATDRFGVSAAQLATFTMLQLAVYAGMQIPVGLLVDRFGSRGVLLVGTVFLAGAQACFALAETYPAALAARVLVGIGDSMTFICVLRLVTTWFPGRRIPLMTQLTGTLGQLGAVIAALPMTWSLHHLGWTRSYLLTASLGLALAVAILLVLRDSPAERTIRGARLDLAAVRSTLGASWQHPGTRLGFWIHFSSQFSATTLGLLWGYPYFVEGQGLSSGTAGALLTLMVIAVMAAGPALGWLVGLHPWHRSSVVLVIVWSIVVTWTVVLLWPGRAPLPLLVVLVIVVGIGGPASVIGFDVGRTSNPNARLASASGIINQAGFVASLLLVIGIGVVLDWRTPTGQTSYEPDAFRWAMAVHYPLWALGLTQIWRYRRRARAVIDRAELEGIRG
ncbi:nitrate/nitrite transporter [Nocardioides sp. R-C-SC26]|uniref:MFS transporter n=1 Tax=Nocardioides sp. R-C-SC26 TaxID=2870414 RepID=UPI001E365512|nr:MFS transporter [Nocardioides sp. R-C-SC26]